MVVLCSSGPASFGLCLLPRANFNRDGHFSPHRQQQCPDQAPWFPRRDACATLAVLLRLQRRIRCCLYRHHCCCCIVPPQRWQRRQELPRRASLSRESGRLHRHGAALPTQRRASISGFFHQQIRTGQARERCCVCVDGHGALPRRQRPKCVRHFSLA